MPKNQDNKANKFIPQQIGVFDSGLGGLSILIELQKQLPNYDYIYFGDNKNAPYGDKSPEEIYQLTLQAVEFLFKKGAKLVILACNTASAVALRKIQQEFLPKHYPNHKVLGILVPTIEKITGQDWLHYSQENSKKTETKEFNLGIIGTEKTIGSQIYPQEIQKRNPHIKVSQLACPLLVPLIEKQASQEELRRALTTYLKYLPLSSLNAILLGCTHYELIADLITDLIPQHIKLYKQPSITAESLSQYIIKHPELNLSQRSNREYLSSGSVQEINQAVKKLFPSTSIHFEASATTFF